tara:strand:- start:13333 stop:13518 length:186 start_codon:yes stop_codon:yes gene_type:complete
MEKSEKVKKNDARIEFEYLDNLRESGVTNMFGAGVYLENEFGLEKKEARKVLANWMTNKSI